ncbi:MAG TPA: GAP family protein [Nocardioidaceae bacterium]|nr:GAP family protein [Nocardioidaceae bacterium]
MGEVIGALLPLALGVAVSPIPIIAAILVLLSPRAGSTSGAFLLGWVAGIVVATSVFVAIASGADLGSASSPSAAANWIKIGLGVVLLLVGVRQWRTRPRGDDDAVLPAWMKAIDTLTPVKAIGLGFLLAALNPKNLTLCIAAGVEIGGGGLSNSDVVIAVAVFVVLAASSVAVPVIAYAIARDRMASPLDELRTWLTANNAVVMAVLLAVIGVVMIGKGIGGFD